MYDQAYYRLRDRLQKGFEAPVVQKGEITASEKETAALISKPQKETPKQTFNEDVLLQYMAAMQAMGKTQGGGSSVGNTGKSSSSYVSNLSGSIGDYANAIGQIESSNNYNARGPAVKKGMYAGQRALGRYQIMPGNLPSWSKAALGRTVSAEEFMQNPEIQDKIFQHRFSQIVDQYGSFEDAASVWHSGRPLSRSGGANDGYINTSEYVDRARNALRKYTG